MTLQAIEHTCSSAESRQEVHTLGFLVALASLWRSLLVRLLQQTGAGMREEPCISRHVCFFRFYLGF